jgi:hypothetical protein
MTSACSPGGKRLISSMTLAALTKKLSASFHSKQLEIHFARRAPVPLLRFALFFVN